MNRWDEYMYKMYTLHGVFSMINLQCPTSLLPSQPRLVYDAVIASINRETRFDIYKSRTIVFFF